jgi:predicted esterase
MKELTIAATTHGRFLVDAPGDGPKGLLIGCHGYAESAETHLARLQTIPGVDRWVVVSVQGLHRFYRRRSNEVIASWMTRQDRELMIADNVAYVSAVAAQVLADTKAPPLVVFAGFSQGTSMAYRAAAASATMAAVIALGGDIPPDVSDSALGRLRGVLIGHGSHDQWYTAAKVAADVERLGRANARFEQVTLDAPHEWTDAFSAAAGALLMRVC